MLSWFFFFSLTSSSPSISKSYLFHLQNRTQMSLPLSTSTTTTLAQATTTSCLERHLILLPSTVLSVYQPRMSYSKTEACRSRLHRTLSWAETASEATAPSSLSNLTHPALPLPMPRPHWLPLDSSSSFLSWEFHVCFSPIPAWPAPSCHSEFRSNLPHSERFVLPSHTQSNHPAVSCTGLLFVAPWLSPSTTM